MPQIQAKEFVSLNVNNQLKNEDTLFLQNLEENPKETGLPEYISKISHKGMSINDNFRVGRGVQKSPNIGRHRVEIIGHGRYLQVKMAKKRRELSNLFVTSKNETMNSPIKVLHKGQRAF